MEKQKTRDDGAVLVFKLGHGWFGGGFYRRTISDTIDSHIACWHILIIETDEENSSDEQTD